MNALVHTPFAAALGWTLFHSLWEGVIVAAVLAVALCVARSSRTRYLCAGLAMIAILAAAAITLIRMMPEHSRPFTTPLAIPAPALTPDLTPGAIPKQLEISAVIPWLTPFWIVGVIAFYLRGAASWAAASRLRRTGVCLAPEAWQQRLQQLGERLKLTTAVALLESSIANTPVVIGFLRPVILTPVGMLAGMPASQIESILLHELAHVRRGDYLANLLQTVAEGLLFYHPAVWWISHVLRVERENCCDDLVVIANGNAHEYATALSVLAENRLTAPLSASALSAKGGALMNRIRRLLYPETTSPSFLMPLFSAGVFAIVTAWAAMAWQPTPAVPPAPKPPALLTQPLLTQYDRLDSYTRGRRTEIAQGVAQGVAPPVLPAAEPAANGDRNSPDQKLIEIFVDGERRVYRAVQTRLPDGRNMLVIPKRPLIAQAQTPVLVLPPPDPMSAAYTKWLNEDVVYIITDDERAAFRRLQSDDERKAFIEQFWLRRDPTPDTPRNEYQEEHYRRIQYAINNFSDRTGIPGWKTDRGRIYIAFGPPDELDSHGAAADGTPPTELWRYRYIQGIGTDVLINFADPTGTGEFHMTLDPNEKNAIHPAGPPVNPDEQRLRQFGLRNNPTRQ